MTVLTFYLSQSGLTEKSRETSKKIVTKVKQTEMEHFSTSRRKHV